MTESPEPPVFHYVKYGELYGNLMITSSHIIFQESGVDAQGKHSVRHPMRLKLLIPLNEMDECVNPSKALLTIVAARHYTFELDNQERMRTLQRDLRERLEVPKAEKGAVVHQEDLNEDPTTSTQGQSTGKHAETKTIRAKWSIKKFFKRRLRGGGSSSSRCLEKL